MANWGLIGCGVVAATMLAAVRPVGAEPTVVLRVDNKAVVASENQSRGLLREAQAIATGIYRSVGIRLVWPGDGTVPESAMRVTVVLLSGGDEQRMLVDTGLHGRPGTLGAAPPGTRRIYVFCGRIDGLARLKDRRFDAILGRVIAHEIGHVVLPGAGHSQTGIMSAKVDYLSPTTPGFTTAQGADIRASLTVSPSK